MNQIGLKVTNIKGPGYILKFEMIERLIIIMSFPKTPQTRSEASSFGGSHNYKTKQTTYLHRDNKFPLPLWPISFE